MDLLRNTLGADFIEQPRTLSQLQTVYLQNSPVSKDLIRALMQAAGLNQFSKNRYFEIAQAFSASEVHPEVRYKLAQLKAAYGVAPLPLPYEEFAADV
jgi:hypothetical protein